MTGAELRERRVALGLSQDALATRLGTTRNTVARWEREEMQMPAYLERAMRDLEREMKESQ